MKASDKQWNLLMNCLPMHISDGTHASKLAARYNIDYFELLSYLKKWIAKGLSQSSSFFIK